MPKIRRDIPRPQTTATELTRKIEPYNLQKLDEMRFWESASIPAMLYQGFREQCVRGMTHFVIWLCYFTIILTLKAVMVKGRNRRILDTLF